MKLKKILKEGEFYYSVLTCELTDKEPIDKIIRSFSGSIEINGKFGFADDVFIDYTLISEHHIEDEDYIKGLAIINYNKIKGKWGWKAISISSDLEVSKGN